MLKIKKILSAFCAAAVTVTALAGLTVAQAGDDDKPTLYTVLEQKTFSNSADYDGYTQYVLTLKAKSFNDLKAFTSSGLGVNKKYTGVGAAMIDVSFTYDDTKVGMIDIIPLVTGGSVTKNPAEGSFLWTCTDITQYITSTDFDIAEIQFVSISDAGWKPATEDYTANPVTFTGNPKVDYKVYEAKIVTEGVPKTYSVNTSTLSAVNGTYPAAPAKHNVTVNGGTADVKTAASGDTVTVTPTIPDGKVIDAISGVSSYTLAADGKSFTFTMPAEPVTITITYKDAPKPGFNCTVDDSVPPYYRKATGQVIRRFECSATNMTEASSFSFTFAKDGVEKPPFKAAKPAEIGGRASFDFEVMILGAPEGTTLTVKEAE